MEKDDRWLTSATQDKSRVKVRHSNIPDGNSVNKYKCSTRNRRRHTTISNQNTKTTWDIDTYIEPKGRGEKSYSLCLKHRGINTQVGNITEAPRIAWRRSCKRTPDIRHIQLPLIHPNLYISDIVSVDDWLSENKGPSVIINLSGMVIPKAIGSNFWSKHIHGAAVIDIMVEDGPHITFQDFHDPYLKVKEVLDSKLPLSKVLIVCAAGVNRSVLMAVAYGIGKGHRCGDLINYVADEKCKISISWNILRQFQSREKMISYKL
jgi:hypothetical protein